MTDQQIKDQVQAIHNATEKVLSEGKEACLSFLIHAGITFYCFNRELGNPCCEEMCAECNDIYVEENLKNPPFPKSESQPLHHQGRTVEEEMSVHERLFKPYCIDFLSKEPEEVRKTKIAFALDKKDEAFELFKELYDTNYGSIYEDDNLISIHTGGWSDNEEIIYEFKNTQWWQQYIRITMPGGHYYFDTEKHNGEKEWDIVKKSTALQPPPTAEPLPPPGLHKPFIVANVREVMDKMNDELSYSMGVELLNEIAAKYYSTAEQGEGKVFTREDMEKAIEFGYRQRAHHGYIDSIETDTFIASINQPN